MYFFTFWKVILQAVFQVLTHRKKELRWAATCLADIEFREGTVLPKEAREKVLTSYSIYIPMVVDAFATLTGRKTTQEEKIRMLQYFICSTTFDNFTDEHELTATELNDIFFAPETFKPRTPQEKLFLQAHMMLRNFVADPSSYETICRSIFKAQVESIRQTDPDLPDEELYAITVKKGAFAVLMCSHYMDNDTLSLPWQQCWFQLGGIIQLTNDLFDTWKDLQTGVQTLATRMQDVNQVYEVFMKMVLELEEGIAALPITPARRLHFRVKMTAICSFSEMALHQFRNIQESHTVMPALHSLPRKALIIDMEKPSNLWRCIKFTYQRCRQTIIKRPAATVTKKPAHSYPEA